ncbi:MAG: FAD binding domain-containing protein [Pseudomonadota bacterium]
MTTVETFTSLSRAEAARGRVIGGGTLLMRQVNAAPQTVPVLVRITDPVLRDIRGDGAALVIGAGVSMTDIATHPDLAVLAPVARAIGGPALRNMATLGGNLFAPPPYGDLTVALLALGARVIWAGDRQEDLESFLRTRDQARGIVQAVRLPRVPPDALRFRKVSRTRPKGVSVLSIAACLEFSGSRVAKARLAFGAMGPTPLRAKSAEAALQGVPLDAAGVAAACAVCTRELAPRDDALASAWYRTEVAPVHLRRCLLGEHR